MGIPEYLIAIWRDIQPQIKAYYQVIFKKMIPVELFAEVWWWHYVGLHVTEVSEFEFLSEYFDEAISSLSVSKIQLNRDGWIKGLVRG